MKFVKRWSRGQSVLTLIAEAKGYETEIDLAGLRNVFVCDLSAIW